MWLKNKKTGGWFEIPDSKVYSSVKLETKNCEIGSAFTPQEKAKITKPINELNKDFPEAFGQDYKLRITKTTEISEKTFAETTPNGIMRINKRYLDNPEEFKKIYQKSVKDGWNQKVPEGKELEGVIIHEFGHYNQNMQYQFSEESDNLSLYEYSTKVRETAHINYIAKNGIKDINVSGYGLSSPREWYAEMFLQHYYYPNNEYAKYFYENVIKSKPKVNISIGSMSMSELKNVGKYYCGLDVSGLSKQRLIAKIIAIMNNK